MKLMNKINLIREQIYRVVNTAYLLNNDHFYSLNDNCSKEITIMIIF